MNPLISPPDQLLICSHVDQISTNPKIDVDVVRKIKYLHEFDRYVSSTLLTLSDSTL